MRICCASLPIQVGNKTTKKLPPTPPGASGFFRGLCEVSEEASYQQRRSSPRSIYLLANPSATDCELNPIAPNNYQLGRLSATALLHDHARLLYEDLSYSPYRASRRTAARVDPTNVDAGAPPPFTARELGRIRPAWPSKPH